MFVGLSVTAAANSCWLSAFVAAKDRLGLTTISSWASLDDPEQPARARTTTPKTTTAGRLFCACLLMGRTLRNSLTTATPTERTHRTHFPYRNNSSHEFSACKQNLSALLTLRVISLCASVPGTEEKASASKAHRMEGGHARTEISARSSWTQRISRTHSGKFTLRNQHLSMSAKITFLRSIWQAQAEPSQRSRLRLRWCYSHKTVTAGKRPAVTTHSTVETLHANRNGAWHIKDRVTASQCTLQ